LVITTLYGISIYSLPKTGIELNHGSD
jgi:hypothetical protein